MIKGELSQALYWVMVAVVLGIYLWTVRTVDLWFFIFAVILIILGIGYGVVITGESSAISFERMFGKKDLETLEDRIKRIEEKVEQLSKDLEEIKKLLEE